jgi:Na+-transporting NADH:ubiquinone oxidoreductase subunit A
MKQFEIKKGLNIPIKGGAVRHVSVDVPSNININIGIWSDLPYKLCVKRGDAVRVGQPLAYDKQQQRCIVSSVNGSLHKIIRGDKRCLKGFDIAVKSFDTKSCFDEVDIDSHDRKVLIDDFKKTGLAYRLHQRPFGKLADLTTTPDAIFVKCIFTGPLESDVITFIKGYEKEFVKGMDVIKKLTGGDVHIACTSQHQSLFSGLVDNVNISMFEGPHPAGDQSVHIHMLRPIRSIKEVVWTCDINDVIAIGYRYIHNKPMNRKRIIVCGPAVREGEAAIVDGYEGMPISSLCEGRINDSHNVYLSGNPLVGKPCLFNESVFLRDHMLCIVPEAPNDREVLHFFRLGLKNHTASKTYATGFIKHKTYHMDNHKGGEERAFIDGEIYERVCPMNILPMLLVKSLIIEDYDEAIDLGFLEIVPEDMALSTYVCPSKVEMVDIVEKAIDRFRKNYF